MTDEGQSYLGDKIWAKSLFLLCLMVPLSGCVSSGQGEQMKKDLFTVQKRLLDVEHSLSKSGEEHKNQGDEAKRRIASTSASLEALTGELQKIRGDIDTLRMGVMTGELPGLAEDQDSVAKSLGKLLQRVESLERSQLEILEILEKSQQSKGQKSAAAKKKASHDFNSLKEVEKAFADKRYSHIAEGLPELIAKKKGKEKSEFKYWLAESLYKLGRLREAALAFNELVAVKTLKDRKSKMQARLGDCFRHLGDKKAALVFYQEVVQEAPQSEEAEWAKEQIAKLKS